MPIRKLTTCATTSSPQARNDGQSVHRYTENISLLRIKSSEPNERDKDDKICAQFMLDTMTVAPTELTGLLKDWKQGDPTALQRLTPLIYDELRRIAHRYAQRERNGHTLQTTALVNEAYLRLAGAEKPDWQSRSHFFAVTAQVMRHILIDHARRSRYVKHG